MAFNAFSIATSRSSSLMLASLAVSGVLIVIGDTAGDTKAFIFATTANNNIVRAIILESLFCCSMNGIAANRCMVLFSVVMASVIKRGACLSRPRAENGESGKIATKGFFKRLLKQGFKTGYTRPKLPFSRSFAA